MYRTLAPDKIIASLVRLEARIGERFANAGLQKVCAELTDIARQTERRARSIARPNFLLRAFVMTLLACGIAVLGTIAMRLFTTTKASDDLYSTLQGIDAGFNILILLGAGAYFLMGMDERMKRRRALRALHELRSIIHVIDMHQLTKDPSAETLTSRATASSPKRTLTAFELIRYLDYCSEMYSLTAKVAVLYAQSFPDPVITEAVSEIERTSASLSQKIWQKISIEQNAMQRQQAIAVGPPAAG